MTRTTEATLGQREHLHLIGIGGTGMTALAGLLRASGCRVTGSDHALYPPTSTLLERLDLEIGVGFDAGRLDPAPDLVVVGNAISRGNPELEEVLDRRLPLESMARTIGTRFLAGRHSIVVAGTHGKTTTTSMLAALLERAGRSPGFLIGGAPLDFELPFALGTGREFVIEGDEYDTAFFDKGPKFMHYRPDAVLLGTVEFDHADIYRDLEQVVTAFRRLVNLIPRNGLLVYHAGSETTRGIADGARCAAEGYGFEQGLWRAESFEEHPDGARFRVTRAGRPFLELRLAVPGRHNALNALAAVAAAHARGVSAEAIGAALGSFRGVRRRQEVVGVAGGVTVLDDFAHHPTAISETLATVRRRFPGARVRAVLEPRSWSLRRNVFQSRLPDALALADEAILAAVYRAEAIPDGERLDPERVVVELLRRGRDAACLPDAEAILARLRETARPGDVVVVMSNGGFGGLPRRLVEALAEADRVRVIAP